jgi:type IV secretion system protein VirD4
VPVMDPGALTLDVTPRAQLYLGLNPESRKRKWSTREDSCGIVGPPRVGKTSGLLIPQVLHWDGPLIVATTRGDILAATGDHRRRLAEPHGGDVYVYDPFRSVPGAASMKWTPLDGCEDPELTYRRVAEMTATAGGGMSDGEHWRSGAAGILRGVLHAAAIERRPLSEVARWLDEHDVAEAANILNDSESPARGWAARLRGLKRLGDKERGSYFSVAQRCIEVVQSPTVRASTEGCDLDIDQFLSSRSTLYVVSPSHVQAALAPMIVALITAITQRAAEVAQARGGRLDPPLGVFLDEFANIAPLPGAGALASEGAGRGVVLVWAAQSLDQVRARYGNDEALAIVGASTAKVVFGGLANASDLDMFSAWEGEAREAITTTFSGEAQAVDRLKPGLTGIAEEQDTQRQSSHSWQYRRVLPVDRLRQTPPGEAWLWYRSDPAVPVWTPSAHRIPAYGNRAGYTNRASKGGST